ncbi:unnamed protein product, partial [Durusdinium trenchii]
ATWLMANDALCKLMSTRAGSFIACRRFAVILLGVVGLYACRSSLAMSAEAAGLKPGKDFTGRVWLDQTDVLLLKRSATARTAPGAWARPGGAVNFGESCEAALLREIREETNLDICNPELLDVTSEPSSGAHWVSIGYTADLAPGCTASDARNMEPAKHDDIGFFHLEALPTPLADFTANAVPMLLEKWKR